MTALANRFDDWIRTSFVEMNTALEELYFSQEVRDRVAGLGGPIKEQLVEEGQQHVVALLAEGNTDEGFESGFNLLGNVGLYMAACRRHEITEPSRETRSPLVEASALAMQAGASIGMAPRFATAHLETHNAAVNGKPKAFTSLPDEALFVAYNTRAAFGFIRASQALLQSLPLGISHPVTADLLRVALDALHEVIRYNSELFEQLDVDRFFFCVRPYYKPHRVGLHEYRGANAGDFAGINVIDLLLGLCQAHDPYYSQLLVDKFLFMRPEEQLILRDTMRRRSLLDSFLEASTKHAAESWYQHNCRLFLEVCSAHGETALQHHEQLVAKFIERPADESGQTNRADITASGPPLPVLLKSLRKLCDMRSAAPRHDIPSRFADIESLRFTLAELTQ